MQTMVASLLLHGKSYYERLLNVRPANDRTARNVRAALDRINGQATSLRWLLTGLGTWGANNRAVVEQAFSKGGSWKEVIARIHKAAGCAFFEACSEVLADMFKISPLKGSSWVVPLSDIPANNLEVAFIERRQGGGSKANTRALKIIAAAKQHRANMIAVSHRRRNWPKHA